MASTSENSGGKVSKRPTEDEVPELGPEPRELLSESPPKKGDVKGRGKGASLGAFVQVEITCRSRGGNNRDLLTSTGGRRHYKVD